MADKFQATIRLNGQMRYGKKWPTMMEADMQLLKMERIAKAEGLSVADTTIIIYENQK